MIAQTAPARTRHARPKAVAILVVPLVVAVVVTLFAWPAARMHPRDLPIAVAGATPAADPIEARLEARGDAFEVHREADAAAAREALRDREVYGAFVATERDPELLTASAASPAVAQMLEKAMAELRDPGQAARARAGDLVPAGPAGGALAACLLPMILAGAVTGVLAILIGGGLRRRAARLVAGAVLGGVSATLIVHSWLGVVGGGWLPNAAAMSLAMLAIAATVGGLHALAGAPGAVAGVLAMILIGNPFSGVGSAAELLPRPLGTIGQLMPPGAGGNLLRSTGFFDGSAAGRHALVLVAWTLAGLTALTVAAIRPRRPARLPAAVTA